MSWKIVRDNNEAWCRANGVSGQWRTSPDPLSALLRKILEEAGEYAAEVAPGVFVAVMGWGDMLMPDHSVTRGAMIAVWADAPAGKDGSGDD